MKLLLELLLVTGLCACAGSSRAQLATFQLANDAVPASGYLLDDSLGFLLDDSAGKLLAR